MVKSVISTIVVALILIAGAIYESHFINYNFTQFQTSLTALYEKTENETAVEDDVKTVRDEWLNKKRYLHDFIPHNEIKEVDLWLSETIKLVRDKEWTDALSKLDVLINLISEIPKTFAISFENIL